MRSTLMRLPGDAWSNQLSGDTSLIRIELRLRAKKNPVEVHLYEGYWAPLTDGTITARNLTNTQRVQNRRDPDATTLLIANNEYWKNPLVIGTLYDAIAPD